MTIDQIAAATNYLCPMQTSTMLITCEGRDTDYGAGIEILADELAERFPDAVHVGFGGRVSRGRLADSLPDEVIDPDVAQTIIVEAYEGYNGLAFFAQAVFTLDSVTPNKDTVVIILWPAHVPVASWMINRTISMEYAAEEKEAIPA